MTAAADTDVVVGIKNRSGSIHVHGKLGLGKNKVQFGHGTSIVHQSCGVFSGRSAEGRQNHLNFFLLLDFQLSELIIQCHNGCRLNKEGRAGSGLVMYHAGYVTLVLCLDRQAVAVVAHGNNGILQHGAHGAGEHII